jgi:hypothetical protein
MSSSRAYHFAIRRQTDVIFRSYSIVIGLFMLGRSIVVRGGAGASSGYHRKSSPGRRAFNLEGGFVISIVLPFERNVAVLCDLHGQIGWCGWRDQRHHCSIRIARAAS